MNDRLIFIIDDINHWIFYFVIYRKQNIIYDQFFLKFNFSRINKNNIITTINLKSYWRFSITLKNINNRNKITKWSRIIKKKRKRKRKRRR
jgi:hypothetical protein